MFGLFEKNEKDYKRIRELVATDLRLLPRHRVFNFVQTDGSYQNNVPGRKVSIYCHAPQKFLTNSRISSFN